MAYRQSGLLLVGNLDEGEIYQTLNVQAGEKLGGFDQHPERVILQRLSSHDVNTHLLIGWRTGTAASHWLETWTKEKFINLSTIKQEHNWEGLSGTRNMLFSSA
jgi:hypothetical protein